jgi:hypothetical protein
MMHAPIRERVCRRSGREAETNGPTGVREACTTCDAERGYALYPTNLCTPLATVVSITTNARAG